MIISYSLELAAKILICVSRGIFYTAFFSLNHERDFVAELERVGKYTNLQTCNQRNLFFCCALMNCVSAGCVASWHLGISSAFRVKERSSCC